MDPASRGAHSQVLSSSVRLLAALWSSSTLLLTSSSSPLQQQRAGTAVMLNH